MKAAVVSAIYGDYDTLKPTLPQLGVDVDWIMVTDSRTLDPGLGWEIVVQPRPGIHPNRAAKTPKMRPWDYTSAPVSVWIDASFRVVSPTFVVEALTHARPLAQYVHPWRDCLFDEADASVGLPKYAGEPTSDQAAYYRALGHPPHWGLWATGVIARDHHAPGVQAFGDRWLQECHRWSYQDQVSEPFVLWELGLRPEPLPGTHLANAWLSYQGSANH